MRLLLACSLVSLAACGPGGLTTDAGADACKGAAKTPANLLDNPGFECDSAEWGAVSGYGKFGYVAGGRAGRAGQVTVEQLGGRLVYTKDFAPNAGNKTFCFSAWLKGTAPFMRLRVLREFSGNVQEVQFSEQIFSDWRRIPTLKVEGLDAPKLTLLFEVQTNRADGQSATAGQTMLLDDVDVWESSANCGESR